MRKVLKSVEQVMHYWANQVQPEGRSGNVYFDGPTIYSYGPHFPMATIIGGAFVFTTRHYSLTTSRHISSARRAVPGRAEVIKVMDPTESARWQVAAVEAEIAKLLTKVNWARVYKAASLHKAMILAHNFNRFAELRGEDVCVDMQRFGDWEDYVAEAEAKRLGALRLAERASRPEELT